MSKPNPTSPTPTQPPKRARLPSSPTSPLPQPPEQEPRLNNGETPTSPIPTPSSSPKTISTSNYTPHTDKWGFLVYRTTYSNEDKWLKTKSKVLELAIEQWKVRQGEGKGDFGMAKLKFVEDKDVLEGVGVGEVRLIHNPLYQPEKDSDDDDDEDEEAEAGDNAVTLQEYGGLDSTVCIMIDEASMESILANDDYNKSGYVIAIDSTTTRSEMGVDWDGSMRIWVEALLDDFYLCLIKDGVLVMGEIHNPEDPNEVWIGH